MEQACVMMTSGQLPPRKITPLPGFMVGRQFLPGAFVLELVMIYDVNQHLISLRLTTDCN